MFKKRYKPPIDPAVFIPKPARIMAILQLCLAFSFVCLKLSGPFMGDLYSHKRQIQLIQLMIGDRALLSKEELVGAVAGKLERNTERFAALPDSDRSFILDRYDHLQRLTHTSFFEKSMLSLKRLLIDPHPFELAWLFLSVILSILLLKKVEGARQAVLLLPLITILYGIDNYFFGKTILPSKEESLFPKEQVLVARYLKEPLSGELMEQRTQLKSAWESYLANEWSENKNVENGEYLFNLARAKAMAADHAKATAWVPDRRESLFVIALYLFWNLLFVIVVFRSKQKPLDVFFLHSTKL